MPSRRPFLVPRSLLLTPTLIGIAWYLSRYFESWKRLGEAYTDAAKLHATSFELPPSPPAQLVATATAINNSIRRNKTKTTKPSVVSPLYIHRLCHSTGQQHSDNDFLFHSNKLRYLSSPENADIWLVECLMHFGDNLTEMVNETLSLRSEPLKIILVDMSDWPVFDFLKRLLLNLRQVLQASQIYLITRSILARRSMGKAGAYASWNRTIPTRQFGLEYDFTPWLTSSPTKLLGAVKHYHFHVRNDLLEAIDIRINGTDPILYTNRTKDAAHFWDPAVKKDAKMRSAVSWALRHLQTDYPSLHFLGDIVGWRAYKGRNLVHPDYASALMEYKIVVVCQRDRYQDHWRLFEALAGGALVMTDPMIDYPVGLVENETMIVYYGLGDLREKTLYYLNHESDRLRIARAGRTVALSRHREWHRWEDLILGNWTAPPNDHGVTPLTLEVSVD